MPLQQLRRNRDARQREAAGASPEGLNHSALFVDVFFEHEEAESFVALELDGSLVGFVGVVHEEVDESQAHLMLFDFLE